VVQTAQTAVDHSAWKKGDRRSRVGLAYSAEALAHPFQVVLGEVHQPETVEYSAFWEVHRDVEGALDHSKDGQSAGVDHFRRDHQQLDLDRYWQTEVP